MIQFNTQTGEVTHKNQVVNDEAILSHISDELTFTAEHPFSLNSIKELLTRYPALTQLSNRTKRFLTDINAAPSKRKGKQPTPMEYLELRKHTVVEISELTQTSVNYTTAPSETLPGAGTLTISIAYDDKPSKAVNTGTYLSGRRADEDVDLSLSGHSVPSLSAVPIRIKPAEITVVHHFANEQRNGLDYERYTRDTFSENRQDLTLIEVLHTVMIELELN